MVHVVFPSPPIPLLESLPPEERTRLAADAAAWQAPVGTVLFEVGDSCRDMVLTSEGVIRVSKPVATGQDILLYRVRPGETCVMSMSCLLGDARFPVRGVVEEDARGIVLPGARVHHLIATCPPFRAALFGNLAERLSGLMGRLEEVVTRRLDRRLAASLLARGPLVRATHQQLADELGTAREVISRLLEGFELRGYVLLRRGRVAITDAQSLDALAKYGRAPEHTLGPTPGLSASA